MSSIVRFSVSIPGDLAEAFDRRIADQGYANRSEAVRDLMRDAIVDAEWEDADTRVVGVATLVFGHGRPGLARMLTRLQHEHHASVLCSTHIHLDAHNCMEVVVLRGSAARVQAIASALISARGVKHGKLVCTSAGGSLP
ncbi:MAG: nickel-responsive transcriptional regulator NikR [Chthonomonadales bacterium]|nr:nickel-responsive transcriptional regulator NikR [Chthonomonadales bacterium]